MVLSVPWEKYMGCIYVKENKDHLQIFQDCWFSGVTIKIQCITSSHSQEADTDDQQGTLTYEEFSVFYRMMSLRRDLFLLMMAYSDRKDHLTTEELANFLRNEQKVRGNTSRGAPELLINPRLYEVVPSYLLSFVRHLTPFVSAVCPEECAPLRQSITPEIGLFHACPLLVPFSFSLLVFLPFMSDALFSLIHSNTQIFHQAVFTLSPAPLLYCSQIVLLVCHG